MLSRKVDVYPGDKAQARNVRLLFGKTPFLFIPKYTQSLKDEKPRFMFTPGYDKDWGAFVLTQWRYYLADDVRGTIHVDYRERKDLATGIDLDYKTQKYGSGIIRTYYMNERDLVGAKHFFEERTLPTVERERFRGEWRHKWDINEKTNAIWQYYKLSDSEFLKDYFKREYEDDANPQTYFLLTRSLEAGTLSFRTDARVNRFESKVERLPEVGYDLANIRVGSTGFYFWNSSLFSNLTKKDASPSEIRQETMRMHTDQRLSYPFKLSIFEITPFAGGRGTYYSKTKDPSQYDVLRGQFNTGADLSTKFFRIYEAHTNLWGLDINRLRHVFTPSAAYLYEHDPTIPASQLDQYDGIDAYTRGHTIVFGFENKLQTKRDKKSVDLARILVETDFRLKEDPGKGGFNDIRSKIDVTPYQWLSLYADSTYDTIEEHLETANFDLALRDPKDKWYAMIGKRFNINVDDQITTEFGYKINPKWKLKIYERVDVNRGTWKEQEYAIQRDLHDWTMEINFNDTRGQGSEIWVVFTLKAFPDLGFDFGTNFNRRKSGAQGTN
ncbi:MAG: LPS assembly protein LptD [Candidatus Omnitrophota bacterium]|nr:LPS assembly protein LptD [Candidatus Omnitrophota bacterium]